MKGIKAVYKVNHNTFASGDVGGSSYTEFKVGETYELEGPVKLCNNGFHFFRETDLCFGVDFYKQYAGNSNKETVFLEVESIGDIDSDTYKVCTNKLKIVRYIPKKEWGKLLDNKHNSGFNNSGDSNSGYRNSGDSNSGDSNSGDSNSGDSNSGSSNSGDRNSGSRNSGYYNSGYANSGDCNSGSRNSGSYNSGSNNSGYFNSNIPTVVRVFNKECARAIWYQASKPSFFNKLDIVNNSYKKAWQEAYKGATKEDKDLLQALPNFDAEIFEEITGIKI